MELDSNFNQKKIKQKNNLNKLLNIEFLINDKFLYLQFYNKFFEDWEQRLIQIFYNNYLYFKFKTQEFYNI